MNPIRIILADDHTLVRSGIRALLQHIPDVQVVAEAGDGRQAVDLIEQYQPDLVLMDIAMPGLNGLEALTRISKRFPNVRVVVLSMHANEEYVLQALRSGAAGYLLKDAATPELELAVQAVAEGKTYLSPSISKQVVDEYLHRTNPDRPMQDSVLDAFEQLTPRQREVLQLVAEGHNTQQIAHKLNISVKTVETHRLQLMTRLNIHDIAGLVRYAIRKGIVSEM
jgi:DNA-binding NarL/FixJ family response regulator